MEINIKKEDFLNGIKIVERTTLPRGIQPVLANILIETLTNDRLKFCATDLTNNISLKVQAEVISEGKITLDAKKLNEIAAKIPDTVVNIKIDEETKIAKITCGKTKFEMNTIAAEEYLQIFNIKEEENEKTQSFEIDKNELNSAIKQTICCCTQNETNGILGGVCITTTANRAEFVATDGNRLTLVEKEIKNNDEDFTFVAPQKTLQEVARISGLVECENAKIEVQKSKIKFIFSDTKLVSKTIEGAYPKYKQLIPTTNDKSVVFEREDLIKAIERVSIMVNERTNRIKLTFEENKLTLQADTPEAGAVVDEIVTQYDKEDLIIGFNYKYVLDALKNINSQKVEIEMATSLSATIFKPVDDKGKQICLIMPVQVG